MDVLESPAAPPPQYHSLDNERGVFGNVLAEIVSADCATQRRYAEQCGLPRAHGEFITSGERPSHRRGVPANGPEDREPDAGPAPPEKPHGPQILRATIRGPFEQLTSSEVVC